MYALTLFLALNACTSADEKAVRAAATTLCTWGQLEAVQPSLIPESVGVEALVRDRDLRWLRDQEAARETVSPTDARHPLAGLGAALVQSVKEMAGALTEASAQNAECTLERVTMSDTTARVELVRTAPLLPEAEDSEARQALLAGAETRADRVETLSKLMVEAGELREVRAVMNFRREGGAWVVDYRLPERRAANLEAQLNALDARIEAVDREAEPSEWNTLQGERHTLTAELEAVRGIYLAD